MQAKLSPRGGIINSMPVGSTSDSTPASPRASTGADQQEQRNVAGLAKSQRSGINIYSRPSSTSSSQASPGSVMDSPRRGSLFSSLRFAKVRRESKDSPSQSPVGSMDQDQPLLQQLDVPSPGRLSNFWETFRPRSKSDSRARKSILPTSDATTSAATTQPTGTAFVGWPPTLSTIQSCDEDNASPTKRRSSERVTKPLFVDTQLANRAGYRATSSSKATKSSPIAHVVDKFSSRRRSLSGHTKDEADQTRRRTPSGPPAAVNFFSGATSGLTSSDGRHRILLSQRSLDSGLNTGVVGAKPLFGEIRNFFPGSVHSFIAAQIENEDYVYVGFMKAHKCYDLIPTSAKLVAFDTQLPVKKAFFALVYNGVRAAPLWDSTRRQFVGMLTITDFIHILRRYYKSGVAGIKELEEHKISTWRDVISKDGLEKPFLTVDPSESLMNAVQFLCDNKVHRLPVMDRTTGNILYILTHKRILRFLYIYINDLPAPTFLKRTPKELGIGSWENILTVQQDCHLIDALGLFLDNRVSALPVLDADGKVVDIYAKFDVINLATDKSYNNLAITVRDALKHRSEWFEGVRSCKEADSLAVVIQTLVKAEVHRIVVTDDERRVRGIVSLSDILRYLILKGNDANADHEGLDAM